MNRSSRQPAKQVKLNSSISSNSSNSSVSPSLESLGISSTHSLILPKPQEYFPELEDEDYSSNSNSSSAYNSAYNSSSSVNGFNRTSTNAYNDYNTTNISDTNGVGIILPEPIPPLPPNLNKIYNTRKRTQSHENFEEAPHNASTTSSAASVTSESSGKQAKPVTIPGFVSKLYRMVDESTSNLIKWGQDGRSFVVTRPEDFSRQVLPLFFKHNNFSSFVRQLNMYGFHKVPHLQQGSMAASSVGANFSTIWEFSHINFVRNRPELLLNVRRKIGKDEDGIGSGVTSGSGSNTMSPAISSISESSRLTAASSEDFMNTARTLRQELQFIHQQQTALRSDLVSLQRDNQLLWNENLASRERHLQQQQVIDRILRFLASVFSTDGKLLTHNANAFSALQANLSGPAGSNMSAASSSSQRQRPLLLGNVSSNEDELRRQVLELISGGLNGNDDLHNSSGKIDLIPNESDDFLTNFSNESIQDLNSTEKGISNDISLVDDEISNVLKTTNSKDSTFDDVDFSSYLNCQSLE